MSSTHPAPGAASTQARPETRPEDLATLAGQWLNAIGERWRMAGRLVAAEARLALSTFVLMIFGVILAAGALLFAWGFGILALGQTLHLVGLDLAVVLLLLCLAHLGLAGGLWTLSNRLGRHLEFAATRQLLEVDDD
jgi:hypothetical protein